MQHFKAAIFDMDGLLIDSEKLAFDAFKVTCERYNIGDQSHIFYQCVGTNPALGESILKESLDSLIDHKEFSREWDKLYRSLAHERPIPLKQGANELLTHLRSSQIPMAIATSSKTEHARLKLQSSGILDFFEFIIGGDQVTNSKPNPEVYLKTAASLNLKSSECIAFEDSPNGVKSAVAAGMTVVQIPDLITPNEDLLKLGHIVLNNLSDAIHYQFKIHDM